MGEYFYKDNHINGKIVKLSKFIVLCYMGSFQYLTNRICFAK